MTADPIEIKLSQLDPKARVVATKVLVDQAMDRHRLALQELHAQGWTWQRIGELIGTSRQNAYQVATRRS